MNLLEKADHACLLWINGMHAPWMDEIQWIISAKLTWIPLYLLLFYLIYRKHGLKIAIISTLCLFAGIILTDAFCSFVIKEQIQRYRPSHHLVLSPQLHFYEQTEGNWYKGGQYGFVSSHAANFMAVAVGFHLWMKREYPKALYALMAVAILVAYSRMYLGVHYPSDILGGFLVGTLIMYLWHHFVWKKWLSGIVFETK